MQNPRTFWMSALSMVFMITIIILSMFSRANLKQASDQGMQPLSDGQLDPIAKSVTFLGWIIALAVGGFILSALVMWYAWEGSATGMAARAKAMAGAARAGWAGALQSMKKEE